MPHAGHHHALPSTGSCLLPHVFHAAACMHLALEMPSRIAIFDGSFCTHHCMSCSRSLQVLMHVPRLVLSMGLLPSRKLPFDKPSTMVCRASIDLMKSPSGLSDLSQMSRASRRTSQGSHRQLGVVDDGLQLFSIDGDRTHAICASSVGETSPNLPAYRPAG